MPKVPDYREIETNISLANVKDQIAALLYASGMVHDNEDIIDLRFEGTTPIGMAFNIPITIKVKKHQEVEIIKF